MFEFSQLLNLTEIGEFSPYVIFFSLFFATFVSEDLTCFAAGALAGQGKISFSLALMACAAGIFVGDVLLYWTGRIFGRKLLQTRLLMYLVSDRSIEKASVWLDKNGASAIFLSRFMTGLRLPTYLTAGFLRTDFWKFAFYFFIATAIWTPILIGLTAFSQKMLFVQNWLIGLVLFFVLLKIILHLTSWKNRRLFIGRLKRIKNWEFWSLKLFYLPVVLHVFRLAIKYRSLTLFTCANPAIVAGGFIGESKNDICKGLSASAAAQPFLLRHILLSNHDSPVENVEKAKAFIDSNCLRFPIVLKPDSGERGKGIRFVSDFGELERQIISLEDVSVLQEYARGVEVGVFYYRYPNKANGEVFSITEKSFPKLIGDGRSSLESLILMDSRAVAMAEQYFEQNRDRLDQIPKSCEEIEIVNIGTHSRGAIFSDGEHLKTRALEEKIDEICRGFTGFYFGRFDIRAESFDDLKRGENFKIIELNGVTSESTNIYDKKFSLAGAYRLLFRQWDIAFSIGAANYSRGAKKTSVFDLFRLIFRGKIEDIVARSSEIGHRSVEHL